MKIVKWKFFALFAQRINIKGLLVFMMADDFIRSDGIKIELLPEPYCKWCSKPIPERYRDYGLCYDCNKRIERFEMPMVKINAVGLYFLKTAENQLSKEIWHLKSDPTIADKLGEGMVYVINTRYQDLKKMDIIVPVPSGDTKRPYNQAALLAIYVSKNIGIPYKDILYKKEDYPAQHTVDLDAKENNIKGKIGCKEEITGLNVLLIDDAYITGATKNECARALKECGAVDIRCLVLGRAVDETHIKFIKS